MNRFNASAELDLAKDDIHRIIEMAWEDRTPFEAIEAQFSLSEQVVIRIMRSNLKAQSFKVWRERVSRRRTKHLLRRGFTISRFHCPTQNKHR